MPDVLKLAIASAALAAALVTALDAPKDKTTSKGDRLGPATMLAPGHTGVAAVRPSAAARPSDA